MISYITIRIMRVYNLKQFIYNVMMFIKIRGVLKLFFKQYHESNEILHYVYMYAIWHSRFLLVSLMQFLPTSKNSFINLKNIYWQNILIQKIKRSKTYNKKIYILFITFLPIKKLLWEIFARCALYTKRIFANTKSKCSQCSEILM